MRSLNASNALNSDGSAGQVLYQGIDLGQAFEKTLPHDTSPFSNPSKKLQHTT
jgi:hypothetical protein